VATAVAGSAARGYGCPMRAGPTEWSLTFLFSDVEGSTDSRTGSEASRTLGAGPIAVRIGIHAGPPSALQCGEWRWVRAR
jgi:class 3 adenylate cyclase